MYCWPVVVATSTLKVLDAVAKLSFAAHRDAECRNSMARSPVH